MCCAMIVLVVLIVVFDFGLFLVLECYVVQVYYYWSSAEILLCKENSVKKYMDPSRGSVVKGQWGHQRAVLYWDGL